MDVINRSRMDLFADSSRRVFPNQFLAIKYEDLTKNIEKTVNVICSFCKVKNTLSMKTPTMLSDLLWVIVMREAFYWVSSKC